MTQDDLDKLGKFTQVAMELMNVMEVRQNVAGNSEIVFETTHKGEKIVAGFLKAAPINVSCLLGEVRDLHEFIEKVLAQSIAQDGEPEHGESETTRMLREFLENRKSVVISADPKGLVDGNGGAKA